MKFFTNLLFFIFICCIFADVNIKQMKSSIKEEICEIIIGIMILVCFIFIVGYVFGAGRIDWWPAAGLIAECVLLVVAVIMSIFN